LLGSERQGRHRAGSPFGRAAVVGAPAMSRLLRLRSSRRRPILGLVLRARDGHVRTAARSRGSTPIASHDAGTPRRSSTTQQRSELTRPIRARLRRSSPSCAPPATVPTGAGLRGLIVILWRAGATHPRSAGARRGRSRLSPRRLARLSRQRRTAPRGMNALNLVHLHAYLPPLSPVPGSARGPARLPATRPLRRRRHQPPPPRCGSRTTLEGEIERRLRDLAGQAMLEA